MKRGQATLFIVMGIVLTAAVFLLIFYRGQVSEQLIKAGLIKKEALDIEADKLRETINTCLEGVTGDAVLHVAANGGYVVEPKEGFAYYSINDQITAPEMDKVEQSISEYAEQMIPFCFIDEKFNTKIEPKGIARCTAKITDEKVEMTADYPVTLTLGENSMTVNDFTAEQNARLGLIYNLASNIVRTNIGPNGLCLSCLLEQGMQNDLKIDVYNSADGNTFFVISDEKNKVEDKTLAYVFAAKREPT